MGKTRPVCLALALGSVLSVAGLAQRGHTVAPHTYVAPQAGLHPLNPFRNTVASQVGIGSVVGRNGLVGTNVLGYGPYRPLKENGNRNRRGFTGVGVVPIIPYAAPFVDYAGSDSYDDSAQPYGNPYIGLPLPPQAGVYANPQQQYVSPPNPPTPADESTQPPPMPPVTVVLRSGQQLQVQNFAIADGLFWDFSKPVPRKIPIGDIDLGASAKATAANGGEFPDLTGDGSSGAE